MRRRHQLRKHDGGAVAPTVALSLFGLIAAGGLAFDYARLAAMDTELQSAADQAALAAATQLDRYGDSQDRATAAITAVGNANRLAANFTRFANDGDGATVEVSLTFCEEFDDNVADTAAACAETNDSLKTRFVVVSTETRVANYALTPIVAAFSSGPIRATAVAGIESSICNVAPLLVCVADDNFPTDADIGKGIVMKTAGGDQWAPGNYGLLDFGNGNPAVIDALLNHGLNGCQETDDNKTQPGNKNVTDAVNTRMDHYDGSPQTKNPSACNPADGGGCPAANTRKDMTLTMTWETKISSASPQPEPAACGVPATAPNENPSISYADDFTLNTGAKGFTRDTCHYSDSCADGNFGDAVWDRDAYLAANHPGVTAAMIATALGGDNTAATLTRYDIYTWELATPVGVKLDPLQVGAAVLVNKKVQGPQTTWKFEKQCAFAKPKLAPAAYPAQKDRRILPVVAANCDELKGVGEAFEDYIILRVFDVFLTEPSLQRTLPGPTDDKEIYGEVMGPAVTFAGGSGFQYYSRSKPYLVR